MNIQEIKVLILALKLSNFINSKSSPKYIHSKLNEVFEISISLQDVYTALDLEFEEDFELESRKILYSDQ